MLLAKWTIAKGFQQCPPGFPLLVSQGILLELKIDGISTEPDTWKGLEKLQHQLISVGWPRIGLQPSAVPVKESFRSGILELQRALLPQVLRNVIRSTSTIQIFELYERARENFLMCKLCISAKNWLQLTAYSDVGHNQNWEPGTKIAFLCGKA